MKNTTPMLKNLQEANLLSTKTVKIIKLSFRNSDKRFSVAQREASVTIRFPGQILETMKVILRVV